MITAEELLPGLSHAMARAGYDAPAGLERLTGGATMESWRFVVGDEAFVLRRAPSLEFMADRPYGHDVEAAVIRVANAAGVTAPRVVAELEPEDGIGSGFVMEALPGTPDPKAILAMEDAAGLLREVAGDLARIHAIKADALPQAIPTIDYRAAIADFRAQFEEAGASQCSITVITGWAISWLRMAS